MIIYSLSGQNTGEACVDRYENFHPNKLKQKPLYLKQLEPSIFESLIE